MQKKRIIVIARIAIFLVFFVSCKSLEKRMVSKSAPIPTKGYISHSTMQGTDILQICRKNLEQAQNYRQELVSLKNNHDFYHTLNLYNEILVQLNNASSKASLLANVHPDEKIRKDAETCEQETSKFITDLSLDRNVYEALAKIDLSYLDPKARRMLTQELRDFKRAGVDKDDVTREKIKALNEELISLGQKFGENIRNDRFVIELNSSAELAGLPQDYIDSHKPGTSGKIAISTDYPDYIPFMNYASSNALRKDLRFKFLNRGEKNGPILKSLIEKRNEKAKLLGYSSYADYVLEDKMIKKSQSARDFIAKITALSKDGADKEYAELLNFKKKLDPAASTIFGYESAFLEEGYKKDHFGFDSQKAREFFSYNKVRDGVMNTTAELFGIKYVPVENALVWHESVQTYDVYDEHGKLGRIHLDMHPREGKFKHAAQFTVRSGLNNRQYPEGALVCNFPKPTAEDPHALMEHDQVVTFFHEFGHLLHHTFAGKQEWMSFSGVATEWDFVEAPSQLLEEWAWSDAVLQTFAKHYQTGEPISKDLVDKMKAANEFGKALSVRQQMFYAALSLNYFDLDPSTFEPLEMLKKLQGEYSYFPYEEGTHFCNNFGHLDDYSAMYYTYMWSLSLAKDLFLPFARDGLMNKEHASRYRDVILKAGGSKDAADLVQEFLGRTFSFDAFKNWLTQESVAISQN